MAPDHLGTYPLHSCHRLWFASAKLRLDPKPLPPERGLGVPQIRIRPSLGAQQCWGNPVTLSLRLPILKYGFKYLPHGFQSRSPEGEELRVNMLFPYNPSQNRYGPGVGRSPQLARLYLLRCKRWGFLGCLMKALSRVGDHAAQGVCFR